MKQSLIITLILLSWNVFSQSFFLEGNKSFNNKEFRVADSLYTLSLCDLETNDAYFNRAISKLYLGDTINACNDLEIMTKKYLDDESIIIYHNICCNRVDTNFYDKKFTPSVKTNYKYYEIIRWEKYSEKIYGTLHNIRKHTTLMSLDFNCNSSIHGRINDVKSNIIAFFKVEDSQKIYTNIYNYKPVSKSPSGLDDIRSKAKFYLKNKYNKKLKEHSIDELSVRVKCLINEDGTLSDIRVFKTIPKIDLNKNFIEFEKDIIQIVSRYPNYNPAKVNGKPAIYEYIITLVL